jgi:transposase-like protein
LFQPLTWTDHDARTVLDEWRRSGDSLAGFARKHGVTSARLYWWRKKLQATRAAAPAPAPRPPSMSLVPASIMSGGATLTIRLSGEVSIDVADASPSWVAAMVAELTRSLP